MFTNYEKLAKEILKQVREEPDSLSGVIDVNKIKKDLQSQFLEVLLDELLKLEKAKILREANKLDFIGEMRLAVKKSVETSVQKSINDILEIE